MLLVPFGQALAWTDEGDTRGPGPYAEGTPWSDPLDDMTNVYVPTGGLVGVEVSGGNAHLQAGHDSGWIASSIIESPDGYRYDLVVLEVETPGDSWVNITILDPSKAPTENAFANATVPGFINMTGTDVSVFRVPVAAYPGVRIQVNLHASGLDRPRLLSWSMLFIDMGHWRDDLLGSGKMSEFSGLNITSGDVGLDLTDTTGGTPEAYPPVLFPDSRGDVDIFFGNDNNDSYQDGTTIANTGSTRGMDTGDLDDDGYMDIVLARGGNTGSLILWGSDTGKWSTSDSFTLSHTDSGTDAAIGDFDGDDHMDFVISAVGGMVHDGSYVWLNKGDGTFNKAPDITLDGGTGHVDAGDLNNDGYDDIVLTKSLVMDAPCFFGGTNGPDNTADLNFLRGITMTSINQVLIEDVDGDDYLDVLFAVIDNKKVPVYIGGASGPDVTADYTLAVKAVAWDVAAGDVDDDGYVDLAYTTGDSGGRNGRIEIFKGTSTGWSTTDMHEILMGPDPNPIELIDVDADGYDDILCGESASFKVFKGDATWPTAADITKQGLQLPGDMAVASARSAPSSFSGQFTTEMIPIPTDLVWDVLYLDAYVPEGTEVTISVLDSTGEVITGYEGLTGPAVDLRNIGQWRSIQVRVDMSSQSNSTTPVLHSLLVNWHIENVWRDQFFGDIKSTSMLNLEERGLHLAPTLTSSARPDLLFANLRSNNLYDVLSTAFMDAGPMDYNSLPPLEFNTRGASAVDSHDINDDGFPDLAFASYGNGPSNVVGESPVFLGSPAGWYDVPYHSFPTVAATDILMEDLNGDGHVDVVIAQDNDMALPNECRLYWGNEDGWNATHDMEFVMEGARDVEAVDLDDDDMLDLVFACYGTQDVNTDSMVFYQESAGFCGTVPSHKLSTVGAMAVDVGDLDGDGNLDIVFANSFDGDTYLIDSYVYWGQSGRGFKANPTRLPTMGAMDVAIADLDEDLDLDIVFANQRNATSGYRSEAGIYLNDGTGQLATSPVHTIPTNGAYAVAVTDLDRGGWMDLVFACRNNGTGYRIPSVVHLGGMGTWAPTPSFVLPTTGAVDVLPVTISDPDIGGYLSEAITPDPSEDPGAYHILSYVSTMGTGQTGTLSVLDAETGVVLAVTTLLDGENEWDISGLVSYHDHPSIRVMVVVMDMRTNPGSTLDDLRLNWVDRIPLAPRVIDVSISNTTVYRADTVILTVNASDDFDHPLDLALTVEHRLEGETDWRTYLVGGKSLVDDLWEVTVAPDRYVALGMYTFRVNVTDSDGLFSGFMELEETLEVLPNLTEAPNLLSATARDGMVELEWRAPHITGDLPLDGFRILRGTTEGDLAVVTTVSTFTDNYEDTGLTNGQTYHFAVVAYNDLGDSPWSQVLNATPMGLPGVPLDLSVVPGDASVTVKWYPPVLDGGSPILGYRVFRGVFDGPLEKIADVGVVTEYLDEGLTNGQEYFYTVLAFTDQGDGPQAVAIAAFPLGLPGAPTDVSVDAGVMTLTLSWGSPVDTGGSALTGFMIYRGPSADDLGILEALPAITFEYLDDDLVAGQTYHYAVAALTNAGEGPMSPVVSVVALDVPGAPVGLVAVAGDGQVVLTWTAPADGGSPITGYTVTRTSGGSTETFEVGVATTYTDTTVTNGETYLYTVHARNENGKGTLSVQVESSPFKSVFVPGQIASLSAVANKGKVTVSWTPPTDDGGSVLTGYIVLRGDTADAMTEVAQVGIVTSFIDIDVDAGKTYYYTVKAVNAVGQGDPADPVMVKVQKEVTEEDSWFPLIGIMAVIVVAVALVAVIVVRPMLKKD